MKHKAAWKKVVLGALVCALALAGVGVVSSGAMTTYSIGGTVTAAPGGNWAGHAIKARAYSLQWNGSAWTWQPTGSPASVSAAGTYAITGLQPGSYRVGFSDESTHTEYMPVFYENASTVASATTITIVDSNITGINQQVTPNPFYSIRGRVGYTDGDWADSAVAAVPYFKVGAHWVALQGVPVSQGGTYTISGVRPGTYRMAFLDANRVYAPRYYDSVVTSIGAATDITITTTGVAGIDETLTALPKRKITGRVAFVGATPVLGDVRAYVYSQVATDTWRVDFTSVVATDGTYAVHVTHDKTYRVGFMDSEDVFRQVYFGGASKVESAADIAINAPMTFTANATMTADVSKRTFGTDPIDTALKVSRDTFPAARGGTVVVANAGSWAEIAIAAPYAKMTDSPLLLIRKSSVSDEVLAEIGRIDPDEVVVIGSPSVVSFDTEQIFREAGVPVVRRLGGTSRYATSASVAQELMTKGLIPVDGDGKMQGYFVVGDRNPWDAAIAAPMACAGDRPILIVQRNKVPAAVQNFLESNVATTTDVTILGNANNVSDEVAELLLAPGSDPELTVERVGAEAPNRGALSVAAAEYALGNYDFSSRKFALCTSSGLSEALALAPYLATNRTTLLVTGNELVRRAVPESPGAYTWMSPAVEVYISKQVKPDLDPSGELPRNFGIAYLNGIGQMDSELWNYALREAGLTARP